MPFIFIQYAYKNHIIDFFIMDAIFTYFMLFSLFKRVFMLKILTIKVKPII